MSFHFAAADSRVGPIAGFSPVTDLLTLHELSEMQHDERARALAAVRLAGKLYRHPIWIMIGNTDHRVGTDRAMEFTQRIIETSEAHELVPPIQFRVLPAKGDTPRPTEHTPGGAMVADSMGSRRTGSLKTFEIGAPPSSMLSGPTLHSSFLDRADLQRV